MGKDTNQFSSFVRRDQDSQINFDKEIMAKALEFQFRSLYDCGERLYLKGVVGMDEKIVIKKQDFYEIMYLMEKILYIAERSGAREDSDNNAYSLAITFGKENVVQELLSLRRKWLIIQMSRAKRSQKKSSNQSMASPFPMV